MNECWWNASWFDLYLLRVTGFMGQIGIVSVTREF